jgi:hypothetical protein
MFGQQSWLPPWITPYGTPAQAPQQQQESFNPNWAATLGTSQPQAQPMPQPATPRPQQRRPQPISFTPQAAQMMSPDASVAVPYMDAQGQRQMGQTQFGPAPGQSQAQVRAPSFTERLGTWSESPLLQMGLSLLGNSRNGGDWGAVGQDLRQFGQDRTQRQRQANEDRRLAAAEGRETEQFNWMRDERLSVSQRRQLARDFIASHPEAERAELAMIDPDELGTYLQQRRQFELQQQQLELQTQEARDNRAYRGASLALDRQRLEQDRVLNSADSLLGRGEATRINDWMGRLDGWNLVQNDIASLEEILQRNPAAFDQILDGDQSLVLARVRDPQMRADLNTIYAVSGNLAREDLRGQTPVSNIDFLAAVRSNPNVQSGSLFARDWLARARQDRQNLEGQVQSALRYRQGGEGGASRSLYEPDPQTGLNWYQSPDGYTRFNRQNGGASAGGGQSDEARQAAAALAARGGGAPAPQAGTAGGRAGAPRLLRQPDSIFEQQLVREYTVARDRGQTARARTLETRMRRAGLIP